MKFEIDINTEKLETEPIKEILRDFGYSIIATENMDVRTLLQSWMYEQVVRGIRDNRTKGMTINTVAIVKEPMAKIELTFNLTEFDKERLMELLRQDYKYKLNQLEYWTDEELIIEWFAVNNSEDYKLLGLKLSSVKGSN